MEIGDKYFNVETYEQVLMKLCNDGLSFQDMRFQVFEFLRLDVQFLRLFAASVVINSFLFINDQFERFLLLLLKNFDFSC